MNKCFLFTWPQSLLPRIHALAPTRQYGQRASSISTQRQTEMEANTWEPGVKYSKSAYTLIHFFQVAYWELLFFVHTNWIFFGLKSISTWRRIGQVKVAIMEVTNVPASRRTTVSLYIPYWVIMDEERNKRQGRLVDSSPHGHWTRYRRKSTSMGRIGFGRNFGCRF